MERPRFHHPRPVLFDQFGIGQLACARILADVSRQEMHRAAPRAFRNLMDAPDEIEAGALTTIHEQAALERQALTVMEAN